MDKSAALYRIALSIGLAVAGVSTQAEPGPVGAPRFELDTERLWTPRPALPRGDGQRLGGLPQSVPSADARSYNDVMRARWWWGRGKLAVGAGADWTASTASTPSAQPAPLAAAGADPLRPRFALEFRAKAVGRDLRESLLRVQLSGDGALHFRPRSGGLQISYRERF